MSNAWGLTLVAIGAIFAFAISGHPSWIDLHIVGWVIMLTGIAGMVLKRVDTGRLPRWLIVWRSSQRPQPPGGQPAAITGTVITGEPVPGSGAPPTSSAPGGTPGGVPPSTAAPGDTSQESHEE
jgi:uncharacterized protein DUF6458